MRIAFGADDDNECTRAVIDHLRGIGALDTFSSETWPEFAQAVGRAVAGGAADYGVVMCWTGTGTSIAANKVPGVRAAPCHDTITAEMSRRHNDANVLCLSADLLGDELIDRMVRIWLETPFEGGRHARRVEKIMKYEAGG